MDHFVSLLPLAQILKHKDTQNGGGLVCQTKRGVGNGEFNPKSAWQIKNLPGLLPLWRRNGISLT